MDNSSRRRTILHRVVLALSIAAPAQLAAQNTKSCHIRCAAFSFWTEVHRSHVADHPRVRDLTTGAITRLPSSLPKAGDELPKWERVFLDNAKRCLGGNWTGSANSATSLEKWRHGRNVLE
jgi:hypothetical protein